MLGQTMSVRKEKKKTSQVSKETTRMRQLIPSRKTKRDVAMLAIR